MLIGARRAGALGEAAVRWGAATSPSRGGRLLQRSGSAENDGGAERAGRRSRRGRRAAVESRWRGAGRRPQRGRKGSCGSGSGGRPRIDPDGPRGAQAEGAVHAMRSALAVPRADVIVRARRGAAVRADGLDGHVAARTDAQGESRAGRRDQHDDRENEARRRKTASPSHEAGRYLREHGRSTGRPRSALARGAHLQRAAGSLG
jgi:hypothetical protein